MRALAFALATFVSLYVVLCLVFYLNQRTLIYFPLARLQATPARMGMPYEDVTFKTSDGVALRGWAVPAAPPTVASSTGGQTAPPAAPWVLYCHGNGGNRSFWLPNIALLHGFGVSVFIFDYRGYGESQGKPSERGLYLDAEAAWTWLVDTQHVPPSRVVVWGESLGGGVATWLALHHPPEGLVLESTFTRLADVGAFHYPWLPIRMLCNQRFPSVDRVGRITCPKLFMHGQADQVVPYALGNALYNAAAPPRLWLNLRGGHNADLLNQDPLVLETIRSFVRDPKSTSITVAEPLGQPIR